MNATVEYSNIMLTDLSVHYSRAPCVYTMHSNNNYVWLYVFYNNYCDYNYNYTYGIGLLLNWGTSERNHLLHDTLIHFKLIEIQKIR